eukprot:15018916-Alexandrium_andersonii.AAC.1
MLRFDSISPRKALWQARALGAKLFGRVAGCAACLWLQVLCENRCKVITLAAPWTRTDTQARTH